MMSDYAESAKRTRPSTNVLGAIYLSTPPPFLSHLLSWIRHLQSCLHVLTKISSCSVACNKIHRENHPPDPTPAPKPSPPPAASATAATAPEESNEDSGTHQSDHRFGTLERSKELQYLFKKYPRLPKQLLDIHAATLPPPSEKSRIPASLLKDLPESSNGWDRDKAMASGKEALRKARGAKGEDGEALREYSELVLHLTKDKVNNR